MIKNIKAFMAGNASISTEGLQIVFIALLTALAVDLAIEGCRIIFLKKKAA